ncbi:uncharacterized protein LOC134705978 [Mytilus trossulus]|uniref:uncharacterized protein LOC134705978 n=1 Tax=Mytilus trossulus TaxID=6551 RepID=UPI003003C837
MKKIIEDRKQNLGKIHQQRLRFQTDIKEVRKKINKHLDNLEQEIQQDIQAAEQKVQSQIDRFLSKILCHDKSLNELQKRISATKSFATDLQTFLGGKMFEAEIQKEEIFMQSLITDGSLQQINLQCIIDNKMSDILSMTKIGEISAIENPPTITLTMTRDKQAQLMLPTISKSINDINPTLLKTFEIPKGREVVGISGCTIMPTGKMVFVDQTNDRLVIHKENGSFVCVIPVSHQPLDVTCIGENTVAITHNKEPFHIEIIHIVNKKTVKSIKTSNRCYGITYNKGRLIYYETGSGIKTTEFTDESTVTTVVKDDGKHNWNYVTTSKYKMYYTNGTTNTVTCYTITGQKVWEYKDDSILKMIRGVAIDNYSNVYVASHADNSVVVISPDGQHARRLLENNGIYFPMGIHFDQDRNILLFTNMLGTIYLYNINLSSF